jgi:sensor domain CHASE-containing protein
MDSALWGIWMMILFLSTLATFTAYHALSMLRDIRDEQRLRNNLEEMHYLLDLYQQKVER